MEKLSQRIRTACVALSIAGIMAACLACSSEPAGPNVGSIVPGVGIKEVSLGDLRSDVVKRLGPAEATDANPFNKNNIIDSYYSKGIELSYDQDAVGSIVLHAAQDNFQAYQGSTAQGAWVGASPKGIKKMQGAPQKELEQAIIYPGLWIRLGENGQVESFSLSR